MPATDQSNILNRLELSYNLRGSLQRAAAHAYQQSHREVTVEHLLLSLADDRDAAVILEASNVEVPNLVTEVADYLGRLDDRVEGEGGRQPTLGRDLVHIFQSAAAAAQKSQRRAVGSALVLAAIVGEGRSPSAQMLRNHGLTFEQAIAALRQANAAQAARPAPEPEPAAPSEPSQPIDEPPAEASDASPLSNAAAPIPSAPSIDPSSGAATPLRNVNVKAARDVLAGARERVAAIGGGESGQSAEPPPAANGAASVTNPRPEAAAPSPNEQANEAPPPPPPAETGKGDKTAGPTASPVQDQPGKRTAPTPELAAKAPPREPVPASKPSAAHPKVAEHRPQAPVAGGTRPEPPPQKPQRRPRWPDWAQQPKSGADAPPAPRPPQPERVPPAQRHPNQRAPGAGRGHPAELRADPRHPGAAGQPPDGSWQPRHSTSRGDPASLALSHAHVARAQPAHAQGPATAPRAAPVPPPALPDGPPFDPRALVEQVPTRMRVGKPLTVNIRVPRRQLEAWSGGGPDPATLSQHVITKAMVMRLKAAPKDFSVENTSPETQWSEGHSGPLSDDIVSWRWTVTPRRSGRHTLHLAGATRIVGRDGLAAERPIPAQRISVRVSPNYGGIVRRVATWLIIAALAGTLGYFADGLFDMGRSVLAQLVR